jgi:PAS domain S-box-containing protein
MTASTKSDLSEDALQEEIVRQQQEIADLQAALQDEVHLRRRAEIERDCFFSLSVEVFCVIGMDGRIVEISPACERMLGCSRQRLLKQPLVSFIHPEDRSHIATEMHNLAAGLPTVGIDLRWRCGDRDYLWFAWSAVAAVEEGLVYAVVRDTSERRLMEEALAEERHLLHALRTFADILSAQ